MNSHRIDLVLETWYPEDHPLHLDLHHPLGKLVGEWGELLDDYMKHLYKPDYGWKPIEELVDIWYYIRILSYQHNISLDENFRSWFEGNHWADNRAIDFIITRAMLEAGLIFTSLHPDGDLEENIDEDKIISSMVRQNFTVLFKICELSNLTIDQLTEASWQKLKPGSERGEEWMKAREEIK